MEIFSEMLKKKNRKVLSPDSKSHGDYCYFHDDFGLRNKYRKMCLSNPRCVGNLIKLGVVSLLLFGDSTGTEDGIKSLVFSDLLSLNCIFMSVNQSLIYHE